MREMKKNIYLILSCMILSSCDLIQSMVDPSNQYRDVSLQEKNELASLFTNAYGCDWTNNTKWCTSYPVSEWYGISTNSEGYVTAINLSGNNLRGDNVSIDLSVFKYLTSFSIDDNPIESLSVQGGTLKRVLLQNCVKNRLFLSDFENVEVVDCDSLELIDGKIDSIIFKNCDFKKTEHIHIYTESNEVRFEDCTINHLMVASPNLYFIRSIAFNLWEARTSKHLEIVDSDCPYISDYNFEPETEIVLKNAKIRIIEDGREYQRTITANILGSEWGTLW